MSILASSVSRPTSKRVGEATLYVSDQATLLGFAVDNIVNTTNPVQIDVLIWSTNHATKGQLRLQPYSGGTAAPIAEPKYDASGEHGWSPSDINTHGSAFWETLVYDTGNNRYEFALRKGLFFPEGVVVQLRNTGAESGDAKVAAVVYGSTFTA